MALVAGVDSSTQSVKVVVCDADTGAIVRTARAPHPAGTEVSAESWWRAYQEATADPALLADVEALAVGGQQHGMVTLDESGTLVRDALLWNDNRSAPDATDLIAELDGAQAWADAVGSVPVASMTVAKVRWLARAEPDNAARTTSVLLPHDWLTWRIGERSFEPTTDRGDASGTCYFDATANEYRRDLVQLALGHDLVLPRVAGPNEVVGHTPDGIALAASDWVLPPVRRSSPWARAAPRSVRAARRPTSPPARSRASPTLPERFCRSSARSTEPATWSPPPNSWASASTS